MSGLGLGLGLRLGLVLGLFSASLNTFRTRSPMFERLQSRNDSHGQIFNYNMWSSAMGLTSSLNATRRESDFAILSRDSVYTAWHDTDSTVLSCLAGGVNWVLQLHYAVTRSKTVWINNYTVMQKLHSAELCMRDTVRRDLSFRHWVISC